MVQCSSRLSEQSRICRSTEVDQTNTTAVLFDMLRNRIVSDQTSQVAIDFVLYNGNAQASGTYAFWDPWALAH